MRSLKSEEVGWSEQQRAVWTDVFHCVVLLHSKSSRVSRFDPEKKSEGARPILGSDLPGIQVRLTRNPSQKDILDSDSGHFYPDSRSVWPRNGSGPMGPFSGSKSDPGVFRVYNLAMQELTANTYIIIRSEQHKELSTSRVSRDEADKSFQMINHCATSLQGLMQMKMSMYMTCSQQEMTLLRKWTDTLFSHIRTKGVRRPRH